jgi:gliding motility-associated-like protein
MTQEICNNGTDDDGDGLIDLQDPDCQCHFTVTNNLLQNGSFELYDHCPVVYTYDSNYNVASFWQLGTHIIEADYYHNLGCSYDSGQVMLHMPPKIPLPDGAGFISILNRVYIDPIPENQTEKSYVGQCLQAPLKAGVQYTLSFYAGRFKSWDDLGDKIFPFTVSVFGNADCNAVPFGKPGVIGNGCPSNYPGWVLLGKTKVTSDGQWVQSKISFTVPSDINVLEVGTDCSALPPIADLADSTTYLDYYMYYLDDLHLLPTKDFPFEYIRVQTGSDCNGSGLPTLEAPVFTGATYQWYQDSIAIKGANSLTYQLPVLTKNSYYNVLISTPGKCIISEPFLATPDSLDKINIPADTMLCNDASLVLAPAIGGIVYNVNGIINANVTITRQGSYHIIATDTYGCQRVFDARIIERKCSDCEIYVPNAFTPNGDGLNDLFKVQLFCNPSDFSVQIFDRWGKKVFESHNTGTGWDGTYLGNKMSPDVYVYFISYKTSSNIKTESGTVALIR